MTARRGSSITTCLLALGMVATGCADPTETTDPDEDQIESVSQALPVIDDEDESCSYTHEMSPIPTNNSTNPGGYAVKWKAALKNVTGNWGDASCSVKYPFTDASCLNQQEADPLIFPGGDPPGGWNDNQTFVSGNGGSIDPEQLVIGAAMVMHQWKSPTFTTIKHQFPGMSYPDHATIAIRKVNLSVSSCRPLASLCTGFTNTSLRPDDVDASCVAAHGSEIVLDSVDVAYWGPDALAGQVGTAVLSGAQFVNGVNASAYGHKYTIDPPSAEEADRLKGRIEALGRALKGRVLVRDDRGARFRLSSRW